MLRMKALFIFLKKIALVKMLQKKEIKFVEKIKNSKNVVFTTFLVLLFICLNSLMTIIIIKK